MRAMHVRHTVHMCCYKELLWQILRRADAQFNASQLGLRDEG